MPTTTSLLTYSITESSLCLCKKWIGCLLCKKKKKIHLEVRRQEGLAVMPRPLSVGNEQLRHDALGRGVEVRAHFSGHLVDGCMDGVFVPRGVKSRDRRYEGDRERFECEWRRRVKKYQSWQRVSDALRLLARIRLREAG